MLRIKGIDGLRAIAIICVLTQHQFLSYFSYLFGSADNSLGGIGVSIFFVISGFLITAILIKARDNDSPRALNFLQFYLRRFMRIFPLYYTLIFVGVVLGWQWFRSIAEWHVLYATNIYICVSNQWIGYAGHFWSLAVEEQFYLIWPAVVFFAPRQMLLNAILWSIFIGIISTPLIQVVFLATDLQTYVLPFCHFDALGLGALVAYYYILAPTQLSRAMPGRAAFLSMLSASALLYYGLNYVHYTPLGDFVNVRMFNVITALSIMYCVLEPNNSAIIVALEFWPVRNIGRISYGVYLIHNIVPLLYHGTRFDIQNRHSLLGFAVYLATTFAVAAASWRFFERPILGFKPAIDRLIANLAAQSATGRRATSAPRGDLGR